MPRSVASSSDGDSTSDDFSDWQSSLHGALRTLSLFSSHPAPNQAPTSTEAGGSGALEDSEVWLDTPLEAVEYDARVYNWDLKKVVQDLDLDDYQRIKLINWIRKHNPSPTDETLLTIIKDKDHPLFTSHEDPANEEQQREEGEEDWNSYLRPTFEGDGLLQLSFDDDSWSSDGEEVAQAHVAMGRVRLDTEPALASTSAARSTTGIGSSTEDTILRLTSELAQSQAQVQKFKSMLQTAVEDEDTDSSDGCTSNSSSSNESEDETEKTVSMGASRSRSKGKSVVHGKGKGKEQKKDIDTYYFDSYAANDIHELMLKDTTRTVQYGRFILSHPEVWKDAIVMDVGCGTGILSMFAARAGAKHVYAIEASGLAHKARENIKRNHLEDKITVIQGKVEEIEDQLPVDKVDIIVSEWMGYMLLFEGMFDSVIKARDMYLREGGLMAPSQTRVVLAGITAQRMYEEAFQFWDEVYGFDMTAMKPSKFEEAIVDIVDAKEIVTSEQVIQNINAQTADVPSLDFSAPFSLSPRVDDDLSKPEPIRAFISWFDTFFATSSDESGQMPSDGPVDLEFIPDDALERPVEVKESRPISSFTTGPHGKPTHWKQVVFMLKEPVHLERGQRIDGTFICRKSKDNLRELAIEIHWQIVNASASESQSEPAQAIAATPMHYEVFKVT